MRVHTLLGRFVVAVGMSLVVFACNSPGLVRQSSAEDEILANVTPPQDAVPCPQLQLKQGSPTQIDMQRGGYVSVDRHLLNIPPQTANGQITFRMTRVSEPYVRVKIHSPPGQAFGPVAFLTLSTAGCNYTGDPGRLRIIRLDPATLRWDTLSTTTGRRDALAGEVEVVAVAPIDHLSEYALAAP